MQLKVYPLEVVLVVGSTFAIEQHLVVVVTSSQHSPMLPALNAILHDLEAHTLQYLIFVAGALLVDA